MRFRATLQIELTRASSGDTMCPMNYDAEFRQDAIDRTPEMFKRLREALGQYAASHPAMALAPKDEPGAFQVRRGDYPTFFLQMHSQRGSISYIATQRKNASGRDSRNEGTITIICTGHDHFYYRLDGEDIASEAELAERLLTRLF